MPASKAQQKAVNKYVKANYDLYQIKMPKGKKDDVKAIASAAGESMNQYIINAVEQRMGRDAGGPQEAAGPGVVSLPSDTLKTAQEAAEAAGEDLPQFVARAIQTQIKEDIEDRKAEEDVIIMLRDDIQSGALPEKNRIIIEELLSRKKNGGNPNE